jgi:UDP-N-acetylglucosamine 2-epimerase (non-hydrolysing)
MSLVQNDTTATFNEPIAGYYKTQNGQIKESLRNNEKYELYPEEIKRKMISDLADIHFMPT